MAPNANMKRNLISDETSERDNDLTRYGSSLAILGHYRTLVGENRGDSDIGDRLRKKPKLQTEQEQESLTTTKIEDDQRDNNSDHGSGFLNLVSSAVSMLSEKQERTEKQEDEEGNDQQKQEQGVRAAAVLRESSARSSRSDSLSSEPSIYRSYEMELPEGSSASTSTMGRLPRPPQLTTILDVPNNKDSGTDGCQLTTRCYGETKKQEGERGYTTTNYNSAITNQFDTIEASPPSQILVQTVIYR